MAQRETRLDVLVSNAGIRRDPTVPCDVLAAPLEELQRSMWSHRASDWADTFAVNTTAHYFLSVAFMPLLAAAAALPGQPESTRGPDDRHGGLVVVTSSCASMHNVTNVDLSSYAASKAATDHLVRLLAAKFGRWYIRVAGINPGCKSPPPGPTVAPSSPSLDSLRSRNAVVPSNMNPVGAAGNIFSNLFDQVPAKRPAGEEDIAGAVLYLASRAGVSKTSPTPTPIPLKLLILGRDKLPQLTGYAVIRQRHISCSGRRAHIVRQRAAMRP